MNMLYDLEKELNSLTYRNDRLNNIIDSLGSVKESERDRAMNLLKTIDIEYIEEFLRAKKLQRIRSKNESSKNK